MWSPRNPAKVTFGAALSNSFGFGALNVRHWSSPTPHRLSPAPTRPPATADTPSDQRGAPAGARGLNAPGVSLNLLFLDRTTVSLADLPTCGNQRATLVATAGRDGGESWYSSRGSGSGIGPRASSVWSGLTVTGGLAAVADSRRPGPRPSAPAVAGDRPSGQDAGQNAVARGSAMIRICWIAAIQQANGDGGRLELTPGCVICADLPPRRQRLPAIIEERVTIVGHGAIIARAANPPRLPSLFTVESGGELTLRGVTLTGGQDTREVMVVARSWCATAVSLHSPGPHWRTTRRIPDGGAIPAAGSARR